MRPTSFFLRIGPFTVHLATHLASLRDNLERCYARQRLPQATPFADWHIRVDALANLRRYIRPQCQFWLDGKIIFKPLPLDQAPAFFEWGLNWCIAQTAHQFLQLHAAVVAHQDRAAIFIGAPGAGKSTIAAILTNFGWRLLSDEFALIAPGTLALAPLPRPISIKDATIDLVQRLAPAAELGAVMKDTRKGTVAHLKQSEAAVEQMDRSARPRWLIFPKFEPNRRPELRPLSPGQAAVRAAEQSFNYATLAHTGFTTLADLVACCDCYEYSHNDPHETARLFADLAERG